MVELILDFAINYYQNRSSDGKMLIWPTQALESFWCNIVNYTFQDCVENDMPTLSGLLAVTRRLALLPIEFTTPEQRAKWAALNAILPPLPVNTTSNTFVPASSYDPNRHNSEAPEMYLFHPHRLASLGRAAVDPSVTPLIKTGINSYFANPYVYNSNEGWDYSLIDAALIGLAQEAMNFVIDRVHTQVAPGYRFYGFAPHLEDYEPSADHYANMNTALQTMLLQTSDDGPENGSFVVMPSWPCQFDVSFSLFAPLNTLVTGVFKNGTLQSLNIIPESRIAAAYVMPCVA
jgi:hypothetical protein